MSIVEEMSVIEGDNSVNLKKCNFTSNYEDSAFLCYQSTPGKNSEYVSKLNLEDTIIDYTNNGSVIWVTNTNTEITPTIIIVISFLLFGVSFLIREISDNGPI